MKNPTVLIFGTFNPVTLAHVDMGLTTKKVFPNADIMYVPTNQRFLTKDKGYSEKDLISATDRLLLLHRAVTPYGMYVNSDELEGFVSGRTYDTLTSLYYREPLIICLGADNLESLDTWYMAEEIVARHEFLIIKRHGSKGKMPAALVKYRSGFKYADRSYADLSSTKVREVIRYGDMKRLSSMVPQAVVDFVINNPMVYR